MAETPQQTRALLELLDECGVPFVIIGGVAAVAWGSTEFTRDLDVCLEFTTENLERLLEALQPLQPKHLTRPDLPGIAESPAALTKFRSLLLTTRLGRLDVLRDVPPLGTFGSFQARSKPVRLFGRELRLISLDDLIAVKEHVARPKDLVVAAQLRAIRATQHDGDE